MSSSLIPVSGPVPVPLPYAGFWIRVAAHLIDSLVLGIPFFLIAMVLFFLVGGSRLIPRRNYIVPSETDFLVPMLLGYFLVLALFVVAQWLYFAGMESSARQATFGKAAMSLRVTDLTGHPITFKHATGRFFAKIVSGLVPLAIGFIMAGFTEKKQALHDMIARTLVLRKI